MGFGGISIWQLLIILLIVVLLFGTKRLRSIGSDLGGAIKSFRQSLQEDDGAKKPSPPSPGGAGGTEKPTPSEPRDMPKP